MLPRFPGALQAFFTGGHRFTGRLQALSISGHAKNAFYLLEVWLGDKSSPSLHSIRLADGSDQAWRRIFHQRKRTLLDLIVARPSDAVFDESEWPISYKNKTHHLADNECQSIPLKRMSLSEAIRIRILPSSKTDFAKLESLEISPSMHSPNWISIFLTHAPLTHLRRLCLVDTIYSTSFTLCDTTEAATRTGHAIHELESKLLAAPLQFPVLEELALVSSRRSIYNPVHLAPLLRPSLYLCRFELPALRRLTLSGYEASLGRERADLKPREQRSWLTFAEKHPHIQELTIQSMGIPEMNRLPALFRDLAKLSFTHVPISTRFWEAMNASAFPHLTHCTFSNCVGITEERLLSLSEPRQGKLDYLDISDYRGHLREDTVSSLKAYVKCVKLDKRRRRQSRDDPWAWINHV